MKSSFIVTLEGGEDSVISRRPFGSTRQGNNGGMISPYIWPSYCPSRVVPQGYFLERLNRESKPFGYVSQGHMGTFSESAESSRHESYGGESMSHSGDSDSTRPEQIPNPPPDPAESAGPTGWLSALNSFLEHAFLKADVDTGC
jgi:hypothetical protein